MDFNSYSGRNGHDFGTGAVRALSHDIDPSQRSLWIRIGVVIAGIVLVTLVLLMRLAQLQIVEGEALRERSEQFRIRRERIRPPRGRIFDRNGIELVTNRPAYNLLYFPDENPGTWTFEQLALLLELDLGELHMAMHREKDQPSFVARTLVRDLSLEQVARLEARLRHFSGLSVEVEPKRRYRFGKMAAHVVGTVGLVSPKEWEILKDDPAQRFARSDYIGKTGLEKALNDELAGIPGYRIYERDARGRPVAWLDEIEPRSGRDVYLALDFRLQMIVQAALGEWSGAVVAMDPRNGEVLALYSAPSFDPNLFAGGSSAKELQRLFTDPRKPLLNRAIHSAYSPGSVFKIVSALAGLEHGAFQGSTYVFCGGSLRVFGDVRHCHNAGGHGSVNLLQAMKYSCNVYFYRLGEIVGIHPIASVARKFGLGSPTGIELPEENSGLVPTPEWKKKAFGQPWWQGETISVVIGQGSLLTTPLQNVNLISRIANRGIPYKPHLVRQIRAPGDTELRVPAPPPPDPIDTPAWQIEMVRKSLHAVVNSGGTARRAKSEKYVIAAKTGTAQVVARRSWPGGVVPERFRDHNWIVCFAPYDNPLIALVILIENGGKKGALEKATIASQIIEEYLDHLETQPVLMSQR